MFINTCGSSVDQSLLECDCVLFALTYHIIWLDRQTVCSPDPGQGHQLVGGACGGTVGMPERIRGGLWGHAASGTLPEPVQPSAQAAAIDSVG